MTLLAGTQRALLFDAGYGLWDLQAFLRSLCDRPLTVLLSHAHHDHMLGALRLQENAGMHGADLPLVSTYASVAQRQKVLDAALARGLVPDGWADEHYRRAPVPRFVPLTALRYDLGGLNVRVIQLPGHTPGSIGLFVEEHSLLLTADSWNPQTWVFFPECCAIEEYRRSMRSLAALPFGQVLVSHDPMPRRGADLRAYIDGLTDQTLERAAPFTVPGFAHIPTRRCDPAPYSPLIFDHRKWKSGA